MLDFVLIITFICHLIIAQGIQIKSEKIFSLPSRTCDGSTSIVDCSLFATDLDVINILQFENSYSKYEFDYLNDKNVIGLELWYENELPQIVFCLKNLKSLIINSCSITNLSSDIRNLKNLEDLRIEQCPLFSKLPNEIGDLSELQKLVLNGNHQLDYLPHTIGKLQQLRELDVTNTLIEELPIEITHLSKLEILFLTSNHRMTYLPHNMNRLDSLRQLFISGQTLISLNELDGIPNLETFMCWECSLMEFPSVLSSISTLKNLVLNQNRLASFPLIIANLKRLNLLQIGGNTITKFPQELTLMKDLSCLDMSDNYLQDITGVGSMSSLKCLWLSNCGLSKLDGTELKKLSDNLQALILDGNNLTSLPQELAQMKQLTYLSLYNNPLCNEKSEYIEGLFANNPRLKVDCNHQYDNSLNLCHS